MTVSILIGDVRARLAELPDDHFDCVVTSPPYWGLRDYGVEGQIGLEASLGEHLSVMVEVFREVRRVLKPTGTCWINYGDCYASAPNGRSAADTKAASSDDRTFRDKPFSTIGPIQARSNNGEGQHHDRRGGILKPKDLCLVPQRLAIALQEDGWWIRSVLPWVKRNGMPESISDRPANAVEYVIFATKAARYTYNAKAVRRSASPATNARVSQDLAAQAGSTRANGGAKTNGPMKAVIRRPKTANAESGIRGNESFESSMSHEVLPDRNFRNADLFYDSLTIPYGLISDSDGIPIALDCNPKGFSEAHFATFPAALVEPLLKAGCPYGGFVLDPFGGAGTTALVADRLGLNATLIEINADYAEIARKRIASDAGIFSSFAVVTPIKDLEPTLFDGKAA